MSTWRLYYDGGCNLCHASQLRMERWAARAGQPLVVDVLASDEAIAKGYGDAMVLELDGRPLFGADAWLAMLTVAPWYLCWIAPFGRFAPTRALLRCGYGVVARYRLRWFGTRECPVGPAK